jgi:hypothetical protein
MWKEVFVAPFKVLFRYLSVEAEEIHEHPPETGIQHVPKALLVESICTGTYQFRNNNSVNKHLCVQWHGMVTTLDSTRHCLRIDR